MAHKYDFVDKLDDALLCLICLDVAEEPWQHGQCGRLFCKECLNKYGRNRPCPTCRAAQPQYFTDNRGKREIKALLVKCRNMERCPWNGSISMLEAHMATCKFTFVPCPKGCKDGNGEIVQYMKKDIDTHLKKNCPGRDYECEYCQEKGIYAYITQVHLCMPKKRAEIVFYQDIVKYLRAVIVALALAIILAKVDFKSELRERCESEMSSLEQNKLTGSTFIKVTRFQQKNITFSSSKSPPFYTRPGGYRMTIQVRHANSGEGTRNVISVYAVLVEGKYDTDLSRPFVGKVAITLLNQLEDNNHKTRMLTTAMNARVGVKWGFLKFIPHSELAHDPVKNTQYLKDDTLYFRVSVEVSDHKPWLVTK